MAVLIILAGLLAASACRSRPEVNVDKVEALIRQTVRGQLPGLAVAVVKLDRIVLWLPKVWLKWEAAIA
jgi:CubicO group peptidase (beta-lactamase class C family)